MLKRFCTVTHKPEYEWRSFLVATTVNQFSFDAVLFYVGSINRLWQWLPRGICPLVFRLSCWQLPGCQSSFWKRGMRGGYGGRRDGSRWLVLNILRVAIISSFRNYSSGSMLWHLSHRYCLKATIYCYWTQWAGLNTAGLYGADVTTDLMLDSCCTQFPNTECKKWQSAPVWWAICLLFSSSWASPCPDSHVAAALAGRLHFHVVIHQSSEWVTASLTSFTTPVPHILCICRTIIGIYYGDAFGTKCSLVQRCFCAALVSNTSNPQR